MTDGFVQVAPDGAGKKIDASELAVGSNTVERQRVVLGDNEDTDALAAVRDEDAGLHDDALIVRAVPRGEDVNLTHELLFRIVGLLDELVTLQKFKG